jgi:hypothetical protein
MMPLARHPGGDAGGARSIGTQKIFDEVLRRKNFGVLFRER